jgi:hypothetical protein
MADLADGDGVERRVQDRGDLRRDLHAAACETDDDELAGGLLERAAGHDFEGEQAAGLAAIAKAGSRNPKLRPCLHRFR